MKAYVRHFIALFAAVFGSQASVGNQAEAQSPADGQAWASAKAEGTRRAYESYLSEFPVGEHAREAFTKIIQLSSDPELSDVEEFVEGEVFSIQPAGGGIGGLY
ncbi:MAG: hypothetical protein ACRBM6_06325 [Geminicoccales bacterium]